MTSQSNLKKYIVHIDGDNFFASCELARFPHLKNKPVVVGRERGIAVAYNSHAKALGVTRAMPIHQIQRELPQVVILTSHFELYKTFSKRITSIVSKYMDAVSVYSIDEVFCQYSTNGDVVFEMKKIQKEVFETLGITVSIGISSTRVLAKLATGVQKPNGCTLITESNREKVLSETPIRHVWGIGRATALYLERRGIVTAIDFVSMDEDSLRREHMPLRELYFGLRGVADKIELANKQQATFQSTESFPKTSERTFLFSEISRHVEILEARTLSTDFIIKSVSIYLKDVSLRYYVREIKIQDSKQNTNYILNQIEILFEQIYSSKNVYKSTGVTFNTKSADTLSNSQISLFDGIEPENKTGVISSTEAVKASIQAKYGHSSLYNGSSSISLKRKAAKRIELSQSDAYIYGLPLPYLGTAN